MILKVIPEYEESQQTPDFIYLSDTLIRLHGPETD